MVDKSPIAPLAIDSARFYSHLEPLDKPLDSRKVQKKIPKVSEKAIEKLATTTRMTDARTVIM
jgi:hypothetical protein